MNVFSAFAHNGGLLDKAESIINRFLDSETESHKVGCYLVNPDGTRIAIQKGFKLESYEYSMIYTENKFQDVVVNLEKI